MPNGNEEFLDQALSELFAASDPSEITGQMRANLGETRSSLAEATAQRDRPESKLRRYADPIMGALASIALIADLNSAKPHRIRGAREKFANIRTGIEQGKVQRKGARKSAFDDALRQIGLEQGLDQQGLKVLQAQHDAEVAAAEAKVGVAEMKYKQGKIDTRADKATRNPAQEAKERVEKELDDYLAGADPNLSFDEIIAQMPKDNRRLYGKLVINGIIKPAQKDKRGEKGLGLLQKHIMDTFDPKEYPTQLDAQVALIDLLKDAGDAWYQEGDPPPGDDDPESMEDIFQNMTRETGHSVLRKKWSRGQPKDRGFKGLWNETFNFFGE